MMAKMAGTARLLIDREVSKLATDTHGDEEPFVWFNRE
jgi:hypothetical protein